MKYTIDFDGLQKYLETLKESDFQAADGNSLTNPNGIIKQAYTFDEFGFNKKDVPISQVIKFGQPFLCDALGSDLSVIELSKRKYKLPTGRAINSKYIKTVVSDCWKIYKTALNGYWCIPSQFITYA